MQNACVYCSPPHQLLQMFTGSLNTPIGCHSASQCITELPPSLVFTPSRNFSQPCTNGDAVTQDRTCHSNVEWRHGWLLVGLAASQSVSVSRRQSANITAFVYHLCEKGQSIICISHNLKQKVKRLFCPKLPDFRKSTGFWKVPRIGTFVLIKATCRWRWEWSIGGMILTEEAEILGEKPVSVALCWP